MSRQGRGAVAAYFETMPAILPAELTQAGESSSAISPGVAEDDALLDFRSGAQVKGCQVP
jgi:hypothetical protein